MGIEPTRDLLGPTLVLKTRSTTRHQSPPRPLKISLLLLYRIFHIDCKGSGVFFLELGAAYLV